MVTCKYLKTNNHINLELHKSDQKFFWNKWSTRNMFFSNIFHCVAPQNWDCWFLHLSSIKSYLRLLAKFAKLSIKCRISKTSNFFSGHCIGHMGSWSFSNWGYSRFFFSKSINKVYHVKEKIIHKRSMKNIQFYLEMFDLLIQKCNCKMM